MIYETAFVVRPDASEEVVNSIKSSLADTFKEYGAEVLVNDSWGVKSFAQPTESGLRKGSYHYFMYKGAQSIVGETYSIRITHENNLAAGLAGFEWSFIEFPWAFARAYVGAEARLLFVGENSITRDIKTLVADTIIQRVEVFNGKSAATRLGAMARIGIEGEIYYPVFVNTSVGWGAMNLLGRDTRSTAEGGRGELLTPVSQNESGEAILYHLNFTFMVQVRL
jgi:ribosomal protein S6